MPRKNHATSANYTEPTEETNTVTITLADNTAFDVSNLSPELLSKLCQIGYKDLTGTATAGRKKELVNEKDDDGTRKHTDEEVESIVNSEKSQAWDDFLAGKTATRGPRANSLETVMRQVATEGIRNSAKRQRKDVPKGDALKEVLAKALDPNGPHYEKIKSAAEARMSQTIDLVDV